MSDLRIALVAEGPTDFEIVQAALKAILPAPFVLTQLQPEATYTAMGTGWGGVMKWCVATGARHQGSLDTDPALEQFDLLIVHIDLDVAHAAYADCGQEVAAMAEWKRWAPLPCALPCPPASQTAAALAARVFDWLAPALPGGRTVLCLPGQSIGAWLASATLPEGHALMASVECNPAVENRLATLPLASRIRKRRTEYRDAAPQVTTNWASVKARCAQARVFEDAVRAGTG